MIVREQESLANHTTFRIGGPAAFYLIPEKEEEVKEAIQFAKDRGLPYYLLGKGSNVLFSDSGFDGVVLEIGKGLEQIHIQGTKVTAQAGIPLSVMAMKLAGEELSGFEFAGGIPGTLGGAITMNAGAYGGEIKDCIESAVVLTHQGERVTLSAQELQLGYRTSVIQKKSYLVIEGTFSFKKGEREEILAAMKKMNQSRREKQPLEYPSAGSTFKRPEGYFAGKLIDDAGLRGYRVGDAQVSEKHCGFVVNRGQATSVDVCRLMRDVRDRVKDQFGVELEPEVRIVDSDGKLVTL